MAKRKKRKDMGQIEIKSRLIIGSIVLCLFIWWPLLGISAMFSIKKKNVVDRWHEYKDMWRTLKKNFG